MPLLLEMDATSIERLQPSVMVHKLQSFMKATVKAHEMFEARSAKIQRAQQHLGSAIAHVQLHDSEIDVTLLFGHETISCTFAGFCGGLSFTELYRAEVRQLSSPLQDQPSFDELRRHITADDVLSLQCGVTYLTLSASEKQINILSVASCLTGALAMQLRFQFGCLKLRRS